MPARPMRKWSDEDDLKIRTLREAAHRWDDIAKAIGVSRDNIIKRARVIGVWTDSLHANQTGRVARKPPPPPPVDGRGPFPPGHPITWGAITAGTCLEGQPYDYEAPCVAWVWRAAA